MSLVTQPPVLSSTIGIFEVPPRSKRHPDLPALANFEYETIVLRAKPSPTPYFPSLSRQLDGLASNAVAAQLAPFAPAVGKPPTVRLSDEAFVVVSTTSLSKRPDILPAGSHGEAHLALAAYLDKNPAERGGLQVVPVHEAA